MAKKLEDYLLASKKEFKFRLKFAFQPKEVEKDKLERHLRKYDVLEVGPMSKTIFQANPIDFPDIRNTEIWIMDVVLGFPVPSYLLKEEIRQIFKVSEKFVIVRGENEPMLDQADDMVEDENDDHNFHLPADNKPAKMMDPHYETDENPNAEDYYGDSYNEDFLKAFRDEKAKLDARYAKYDYPAGEGMFPDTPKDSDVKEDAGPTRKTEASSPKWRTA